MKILLFLFLLLTPAFAQQTVITRPYVVPQITNYSSSITTTNTFQTVIPENSNRSTCTFQNKGSSSMWVFFGPATSATKDSSVLLSSQQALSCVTGSAVLREELAVTGTQGDLFYATSK